MEANGGGGGGDKTTSSASAGGGRGGGGVKGRVFEHLTHLVGLKMGRRIQ